ncbi:MAG: hypothetical protein OEV40_03605 [Acidimicrobiia bacterium]|nr:hypothetical protein [Acidimicrobiia bacterium]
MSSPFPPSSEPPYLANPTPHGNPVQASARARKSKRMVKVGLVLGGVGLVLAPLFGFLGWRSLPDVNEFPRASGERQPVVLTEGEWTVFAEGPAGLGPTLIEGPDGAPVPVRSVFTSQTYTLSGRTGESVGEVDIAADGTYLVTTPAGETTAFAQDFASSLVASIGLFLAAVFVGGGMLLIGGVLTLIGLLRS